MSTPLSYGWQDHSLAAQSGPTVSSDLRFSIVIPSFNQGIYIEHTILSVLQQGYPNLQLIVVDAASTDGTSQVLDRYRDRIDVLIQEPDRGQSEAINKGFRHATGDVLAWINSDDFFLPGAFHAVATLFCQNLTADMVIGAGDVISADQHFLRHVPALPLSLDTLLAFRDDRWILQQACFWRSTLWRAVGGVDESLHLLLDYDLWFRFSSLTRAVVTQQKLGAMRYYPEVKTVRQMDRLSGELAYVYAKNGAIDALRHLVSDLEASKAEALSRLNRLDRHLAVRALRKLRILA